MACAIVFIWASLYTAGDLPYDENFGVILSGGLVSLSSQIILIVVYAFRRIYITENVFAVVLFMITSSPVPLLCVLYHYELIFGKTLAV